MTNTKVQNNISRNLLNEVLVQKLKESGFREVRESVFASKDITINLKNYSVTAELPNSIIELSNIFLSRSMNNTLVKATGGYLGFKVSETSTFSTKLEANKEAIFKISNISPIPNYSVVHEIMQILKLENILYHKFKNGNLAVVLSSAENKNGIKLTAKPSLYENSFSLKFQDKINPEVFSDFDVANFLEDKQLLINRAKDIESLSRIDFDQAKISVDRRSLSTLHITNLSIKGV